ncbi:histamine N-methyltransferase-like isoform X2 [Thalassophryne amazonica]|uniref:histamine N-methyltransferase-like isoform X2 n=1 Tax=Thalassophryne amazonica TaxID=390379 RepID=UPI0014724440|nr:histamine N-methyltransferase-like isoform X2 [Thalassophryne amazonica]
MASTLRNLTDNESHWQKSFEVFLECSSEHQATYDFIHKILPDLLSSTAEGKSHISVIGVGSGAGEVDLELLSAIHQKYPWLTLDNEVVEPNSQLLHKYRALVSQRPDLDYIKFSWNMMTASEFEESWKVKKITKKVDFIHMIQVLYYMEDLESTITFYQSLLKNNGKILFILVSSESGWARLGKTYKDQLPNSGTSWWVTTEDVKRFLDSREVTYQSYELLSQMDITECFSEGSEKGELLLDFLTGVLDFSKTASSELRSSVLAFLRHPDCSTESDGRIIFNNNLGVLIADPLPLSKC